MATVTSIVTAAATCVFAIGTGKLNAPDVTIAKAPMRTDKNEHNPLLRSIERDAATGPFSKGFSRERR